MNGFAVCEQHYTQIFPTGFRNSPLFFNPSIVLDDLFDRIGNYSFYPFNPNVATVGPVMCMQKILRKLHIYIICRGIAFVQNKKAIGIILTALSNCPIAF